MDKDKEKQKVQKLKRSLKLDLPEAPPDPSSSKITPEDVTPDDSNPFSRIESYKDREKHFLANLNHAITKNTHLSPVQTPKDLSYHSNNEDSGLGNKSSDCELEESTNDDIDLEQECSEFISPLLSRTGTSVSAALSTKGAIDQLDSLHHLIDQFMKLQEQNLRMTRAVKVTNTLYGLKMMKRQVSYSLVLFFSIFIPFFIYFIFTFYFKAAS